MEKNSLAKNILRSTNVDKVILQADTVAEGMATYHESKAVFTSMKMNLREYNTNSLALKNQIPLQDLQKGTEVKILGVKWNTLQDTFSLFSKPFDTKVKITKRTCLKMVAENFDPLGLWAPLSINSKIFQQALWKANYTWDEPLKEQTAREWMDIRKDVSGFSKTIPRHVSGTNSTYDLAMFGDASGKALAVCAYLITKSKDKITSHILMAKTKVAPIKQVTMPRMELIAMFMASNLAQYLVNELDLEVLRVYFFSDSKITLQWNEKTSAQTVFVKNKVTAIREKQRSLADKGIHSSFHYVNTKENPADCATRGLTKDELQNHIWWTGTKFLTQPYSEWPEENKSNGKLQSTLCTVVTTTNTETLRYNSPIPFEKWNRYQKIIRNTAMVLKVIAKFKSLTANTNNTKLLKTTIDHIDIDHFCHSTPSRAVGRFPRQTWSEHPWRALLNCVQSLHVRSTFVASSVKTSEN
jgi:hypothetical protein